MNDWISETARVFAAELLDGEERFIPIIPCEDALIHTDTSPFCTDERCPCHYDGDLYDSRVEWPFHEGLMTFSEANALRWGDNI